MNTLLKDMIDQCERELFGVNGELLSTSFDAEKFAELIVKECCAVLFDNELGGYRVNYVLKEHFGVE